MDKFLYLENLNDPRTKEFIQRHNTRLQDFLGDLPGKLLPEIMEWYGVEYVYTFHVCQDKVYVVVRSKEGFKVVEIPGERIIFERPGIVVWGVYPSPDCSKIGVGYTVGSDKSTIDILDTVSLDIVDSVKGYVYGIVWRDDEQYYYLRMYRRKPPPDGGEIPSERVILRSMVDRREEVVWGKGLPKGYLVSLYPVYDEDTVLLTVSKGWSRSMLYAGPLGDPGKWKLVLDPGVPLRPAGAFDGRIYAVVYDGLGTGRVVEASKDGVREVIPAHEKFPIEDAIAYDGGLLVVRLVDAKSVIQTYDFEGALLGEQLPREPFAILFLRRWRNKILAMGESFNKPMSLYVLPTMQMVYGTRVDLDLEVDEDWAESSDGTPIHYFVARMPGTGSKHVLLYGYGGFGVSLTPRYIGHLKPLLDHGFSFVMTNLRGGGEYGEQWHEAGRRLNKKNVFEDFKAVARKFKVRGAWVAGWGGSNGGLLVSAVVTQEPDLLDAALIGYPVIDMLRFHKLYIGSLWIDEYGDPDDPEYREYIFSYSPMHNVKLEMYPPTLIYTGLHDDRVHPGHALRFGALLEEVEAPVYLRVETGSGHMGSNPLTKAREQADLQAFLLRVVGLS
ncbi:MAG: prolyl oligopeptidase family serine peptidase [Desulfurococcales archaeon]|nr:prolyl oligopeptidase family serine peptidase [Desulfurococcales archaeon]